MHLSTTFNFLIVTRIIAPTQHVEIENTVKLGVLSLKCDKVNQPSALFDTKEYITGLLSPAKLSPDR